MTEQDSKRFLVIAEAKDYDKALYLHSLSFAGLMDDVVVPYHTEKNFFIDGVPVNAKNIKRIKIVQQDISW